MHTLQATIDKPPSLSDEDVRKVFAERRDSLLGRS